MYTNNISPRSKKMNQVIRNNAPVSPRNRTQKQQYQQQFPSNSTNNNYDNASMNLGGVMNMSNYRRRSNTPSPRSRNPSMLVASPRQNQRQNANHMSRMNRMNSVNGENTANYNRSRSPSPRNRANNSSNNDNYYDNSMMNHMKYAKNAHGHGDGDHGMKNVKKFIIYDLTDTRLPRIGEYENKLPGGAAKKAASRGFKKVLIFNPRMGSVGKYYAYDLNKKQIPNHLLNAFQKERGMKYIPKAVRVPKHDEFIQKLLSNPKVVELLQNDQGRMRLGSPNHRARLMNGGQYN